MKLAREPAYPGENKPKKGSVTLLWLPLTLALIICTLNIYIQKRTYSLENKHYIFIKLNLKITEANAKFDTLSSHGAWQARDGEAAIQAEQQFQALVLQIPPGDIQHAAGLEELAAEFHKTFIEEISLYRQGRTNEARLVDAKKGEPLKERIGRVLMASHESIRRVTMNMHTLQSIYSALSAFAMASGIAILFRRIERNQRQAAYIVENQLRAHNEELESAVVDRTKEIEHQAFHDRLTGLANRALFCDRLSFALTRASRTRLNTATMFLDLDNFKLVNDSLGHSAGDELLVAVAERLIQAVRPGDTVARLGGDEFTILLEDLDCIEQAEIIAGRILQTLRKPINIQGREAFALASIGIAYSCPQCMSAEILMKNADTAMYRAKASGKAQYVTWDESMNSQAIERLELETDLRKALDNNEIEVHYQPLIDLKTGNLQGAEALARWRHPQRGNISPAIFIPLAEDSGVIQAIGYWVMEQACRQAATWRRDFELDNFCISVNLSGRQLQSNDVVERVMTILADTGLAPASLKIEITESVLLANREDVIAKMQRFHELGIKLALDDFGTGYSSLSTLSIFPVDTLKIDRAFISQLGDEEEATAIVEAIIALSKSMKMDVTGEGVETERQMSVLRSLGCQTGQGYLFARPLGVDAFSHGIALAMSATGHWTDCHDTDEAQAA